LKEGLQLGYKRAEQASEAITSSLEESSANRHKKLQFNKKKKKQIFPRQRDDKQARNERKPSRAEGNKCLQHN